METKKTKTWRFTRVDLAIQYNVSTRTIRNWIANDEVLTETFKRGVTLLTPRMVDIFYERCGHPQN